MKKLLFIVFIIMNSGFLFGQQHSYDFLAEQYCKELKKTDFSNKTASEINFTFFDAGALIRKEYADTIARIDSIIKATNDTLSPFEVDHLFSNQYLITMINNCRYYLNVNRLLLDSCPADNKSLQYIAIKINSYFMINPNLSAQQIQSKSLEIIGEALTEIKEQVALDYTDGLNNPMLITDIRLYLLHKSDAYMRAWLLNQSQHLFPPRKTKKP
jgi:hypothetical protein